MCMYRYERGQPLSTTSSWALIKLHSQELYQTLHFPNLLGQDNGDCLAEQALELCSLHSVPRGKLRLWAEAEKTLSFKVTWHEWVRRGTEAHGFASHEHSHYLAEDAGQEGAPEAQKQRFHLAGPKQGASLCGKFLKRASELG